MKRRYDIDWIRVIAIGLLLIYHTAIGLQPWGGFIGFITNDTSWEALWIPMSLLNVWRIPILFYVSGMGVYLALQNRTWLQLLSERFLRIGLPLLFGSVCIVPLHWLLLQYYYHSAVVYMPGMGHLWFLGNILLYIVLLSPVLFLLKLKKANNIVRIIGWVFSTPLGLMVVVLLFITEALLMQPVIYERYAFTLHGLLLGAIAFVAGFLFMLSGSPFWKMLQQGRWFFVCIAAVLFFLRHRQAPAQAPLYLLAAESNCWVFAVLAFANRYLNKQSRQLSYLSEAAYPVYILHMAFLYLGAAVLFPLPINVAAKFILLLIFTAAGSLGCYEFVVKRIRFIRPLFGLKMKSGVQTK